MDNDRDRVKFCSIIDFSANYHLKNIEIIISSFDCPRADYSINDIVELYNICKYIDNGLYLLSWTQEFVEKTKRCNKQFQQVIGQYFSKIDNGNIASKYLELDIDYRDNFWEIFVKYKMHERISNKTMNELLMLNEVSLSQVHSHQIIVNKYGEVLKNILLKYSGAVRIILDKYEMLSNRITSEIFLPKELTITDKETIISNYIDLPEAHINVLEIIKNIKNTKEFGISDKTRLKAKNRIGIERKKLFDSSSCIQMSTEITFSELHDEYRIINIHGHIWHFSYSSEWISNNKDNATLLNNFIYLFEYVDWQMRIQFVNKMSEMGVFENQIFMRSRNDYPIGSVFQRKNMLAFLQMTAYYQELQRNDKRLEEITEWFFNDYLKMEFNILNMVIKMPSASLSFLEKIRTIFPELESVLKQYKLFVENGEIDKELLQISSGATDYASIPSILKNRKYIYGKGEAFDIVKYYLTSDQCMLSYVERIGEEYKCFFDLMCHEQINVCDYDNYLSDEVRWLNENNIIVIDNNGNISWKDENVVKVLVDLSRNEVGSYWHYPKKYRDAVEWLICNKMIEFECTLLTRPESNYISYLLNKSKFGNGFDIRNRYMHGTQGDSENEGKIHEQYYMYSLIVFVICILKINDELCINDLLIHDSI